jgi:hypothetical protein
MLRDVRMVRPSIHVPLRRLALCLDCEECFEVGVDACPACSSETWVPLARFVGGSYPAVVSSAA